MEQKKLKVGQKVYILKLDSRTKEKGILRETEVVSIGNLYFQTRDREKFIISNMLEHSKFSPTRKAYFSPEEYDQEYERTDLLAQIRQYFQKYGEVDASTEDLRKINELLTKKI